MRIGIFSVCLLGIKPETLRFQSLSIRLGHYDLRKKVNIIVTQWFVYIEHL